MIIEILWRIGFLLAFITVATLLHNLATVTACRCVRVKTEKVVLFFGCPLATFQTRFCPISIGWIPTGGYVGMDMEQFPKRSFAGRWLVVLAGPVTILLTAVICIQLNGAMTHFVSGYPQILKGAFAPLSYARELIGQFFAQTQQSAIAGYGILAAKYTAFNMLPLANLPGGRLFIELNPKRENGPVVKVFCVFGTLFAFLLLGCWTVALINYFRQPH